MGFQSTPSLRRATEEFADDRLNGQVSIHALLAESDLMKSLRTCFLRSFNPRPPCGERPARLRPKNRIRRFQSTPSLRRATTPTSLKKGRFFRFNPRPPCGERLTNRVYSLTKLTFQSTPSLRRATLRSDQPAAHQGVSIHALLAESDELM